MSDRLETLGFEPQNEAPYNKFLPYSDSLDAESNAQLAEIKANLGRTCQLRDIKTGASHWCGQMSKYALIATFCCHWSREQSFVIKYHLGVEFKG